MKIELLTQKDWQSWKNLRLEALKNEPWGFGSSFEEESNWPDHNFQQELKKSDIYGAFTKDELIGCAGFYSLNSVKTKHKGVLWGIYVKPEYRRKGIADSLIDVVINHAKSHAIQLHLTCVTTNLDAITLYQKKGFRIYGTEPRALKIHDKYFDEHLMVLEFAQKI